MPSDPIPREDYLVLAAEFETELGERVLKFWFPRSVDKQRGGFVQGFRADGTVADNGSKFLVFQARMTWLTAEIALRYPNRRDEYLTYVKQGLDLLEHSLWDKQTGGPFWALNANGRPAAPEKHAYGIAFAILAEASAARATGDAHALALAAKTFDWFDARAHDDAHGGYLEALTLDGKPITNRSRGWKDALGTTCGLKSMNAHLHLLEALTELYRVGQREKHRQRLQELFELVRDRIIHPDGYLQLYFQPNWTPLAARQSFGHDLEGAFLLYEAAELLGIPHDDRTKRIARRLVDRALARGYDEAHGGFYNERDLDGGVTDRRKVWWVQAEGLNGLLVMHERWGAEDGQYFAAFSKTWRFIMEHMSDHVHGEWWGYRGPAGEVMYPQQQKGHRWKAAYHNGRALFVSAEKLRKLAESAPVAAGPPR